MTKKQKKTLYRILISAALLIAVHFLELPWWGMLLCYLVPYGIIGWDVLWKALRNILNGQVFDENFLMSIATIGAFAIQEYPEAVFVMLFYQVGELFQNIAVGKSRKSIAALMDIRPDYANVERDGELVQVDPEEVAIDDVIVIKPGEKIPLDGVIIEGASSLNTMALTGESMPRDVLTGDNVISGCINLTGLLRVKVSKEFGESTVAKILELVENSSSNKAVSENLITRFARWYTPTVVICAVVLGLVPPIFVGGWANWIHRALIFLVISCPCALVISVPLSFFGGIGGASRCGILVKGANYLEALANSQIVVFDKTGTLTKGSFKVDQVNANQVEREELLGLAALAESYSDHPISESIKAAWGKDLDKTQVETIEELAGFGVSATIAGQRILVGNGRLMAKYEIAFDDAEQTGTVIHVARGDTYLGNLVIRDEIKDDAKAAIAGLKAAGIEQTVMLTGDKKSVGEAVGRELGIDTVRAELLPEHKVEEVEALLEKTTGKGKLVFVGDGINDAPVLSRADIGIAMGALGSDAAIEAADVVLMDDQPSKILQAIQISKRTKAIVWQNIVFALTIKFLVMILGAFDIATMWEAVFADVGVSVIAILNATRALRISKK